MAGPDLVVKVAANISALQADMAKASASIKTIETTATQASTNASAAFGQMRSAVTQLMGAFGMAFSIGAVVGFGRELLADADALMRLHDTTGISIEGLQRFRVAGDDAGNTLDDLTSAIVKMEDKLVSGDTGAIGALGKLGLSFADMKRLSPEQQFITISDAIREIKDPAQQVNIAIDLFGKQGASVLPTLKRGFDDLKGSVVGASAETIKFFDEFGDRISKVSRSLKGDVMQALEFMFGGWTRGERDAKAFVAQLEGIKSPVVAGGVALQKLGEIGTAEMARLKLAEMDLTATAEASIVVNKKRAEEAAKAAKIEEAAVLATTKLWDEYFTLRVQHGGTSNAIAIAQIDQWAADLTAQMIKAGTDTKEFYDGLAAVSHEKLAGVGIDWDFLRSHSIESLQEVAANARATYTEMMTGSQHFSREALDEQLQKTRAADDAARGMGASYKAACDAAAAAAAKAAAQTERLAAAAAAAKAAMMAMGNSLDVGHAARDPEIMALLKQGWSLENAEALKFAKQWGFQAKTYSPKGQLESAPDPSERVPGYWGGVTNAPGGWATVGERGPETMYVPSGSNIYPNGSGGGGDRAEWDRLNEKQAALWLAAGRVVTGEQQKIIDLMEPLTPEGFGKIAQTVQPVTNNITINVTQPFGTPTEIARAVDAAVMKSLRDHGARF